MDVFEHFRWLFATLSRAGSKVRQKFNTSRFQCPTDSSNGLPWALKSKNGRPRIFSKSGRVTGPASFLSAESAAVQSVSSWQWSRTALCQLLAVVSSIVMEWDYAGILGHEASGHNLEKLIDAMGPWEVKTYPAVGKVVSSVFLLAYTVERMMLGKIFRRVVQQMFSCECGATPFAASGERIPKRQGSWRAALLRNPGKIESGKSDISTKPSE